VAGGSVVDEAVVARKVAAVRARVERVQQVVPAQRAAFRADADRQEIVAFNLIVAVQTLTDLAVHVISEEGWGVPETLGGAYTMLAQRGVLSNDLADRLRRAVGLRNILVHAYGEVDQDLVHEAATEHVTDLAAGADAIGRHLGLRSA